MSLPSIPSSSLSLSFPLIMTHHSMSLQISARKLFKKNDGVADRIHTNAFFNFQILLQLDFTRELSSSTRSSPSANIALSLYLVLCTCMSISMLDAFGEFSWRKFPTSRVKPTAISIESSVSLSRRTRIWSAIDSWETPWLKRCAMNADVEW